jgi:hypothetical protein
MAKVVLQTVAKADSAPIDRDDHLKLKGTGLSFLFHSRQVYPLGLLQ